MCFEFGSTEQQKSQCILCNFHGSSGGRACPHEQDLRVCQNRQNHPHLNIVHFTNSEFGILNGCGYCKWVKRHPERDRLSNKGWPGCCRPPIIKEWEIIEEKDWPIVSFKYKIGNPYEHARERARNSNVTSKDTIRRQASSQSSKRPSVDIPVPDDRKANSSPRRRGSPHIGEPSKESPKLREREEISGTPPTTRSVIDHQRGSSISKSPSNTSPQSVTTSYVVAEEKEGGMFHTRPIPRPNAVAVPGSSHMIQQPGAGRQSSIRKNSTSSGSSGSSWSSGSSVSSADPRLQLSDISRSLEGLSLSSTSSNRDSMTTVMSDGGFTDYLSDESEAELQRQAEEAAALLRRNRMEEAEFSAAKRGLQHVDVGTPLSWTLQPTRPQPYNPSSYSGR